jgi:hypothetical protein
MSVDEDDIIGGSIIRRRNMLVSEAGPAAESDQPPLNGFILDEIPPDFDLELMTAKLTPTRFRVGEAFQDLIREARTLARPKAAFKVCRVEESVPEPEIYLDGVMFTGELLRDNLAGLKWAYAYVATEGPEMSEWTESLSNSMKLLSWPIRYAALKLAEKELIKLIKSTFGLKQISSMNPGSLKLWPIEQQKPLFTLLGPLPETIGITLMTSMWMSPDLAASGIFFTSESEFCNCQLCPLEICEHRKTAYLGPAGWPKRIT